MVIEYKLKTVKEILEVVNADNIENFKIDFCSWLDFMQALKAGKEEMEKITNAEIQVGLDIFHWIDDGKNEKIITVQTIIK